MPVILNLCAEMLRPSVLAIPFCLSEMLSLAGLAADCA